MVFVSGRIYAQRASDRTCLSDLILCVSTVYAEACTGAAAGSMAYHTGECDRVNGVHPVSVFYEAAGFFPVDDLRVFRH